LAIERGGRDNLYCSGRLAAVERNLKSDYKQNVLADNELPNKSRDFKRYLKIVCGGAAAELLDSAAWTASWRGNEKEKGGKRKGLVGEDSPPLRQTLWICLCLGVSLLGSPGTRVRSWPEPGVLAPQSFRTETFLAYKTTLCEMEQATNTLIN